MHCSLLVKDEGRVNKACCFRGLQILSLNTQNFELGYYINLRYASNQVWPDNCLLITYLRR